MITYTLAVGTHDPIALAAGTEADAIRIAVGLVMARYADELQTDSQEVVTLLGPDGLVTRPSERLDEFSKRAGAGLASAALQPGDTNSPDCNGD